MTMVFDRSVVSPILVGRAEYLGVLARIARQARDGDGRVVLIAGEAGIGKSRLLGEAKARASAEGWLALEGECFERDQAFPFAPLVEMLGERFALLSSDELGAELGSAAPGLARLLPHVATRLPDLAPLPASSPQEEKHLVFEALAQYCQRLAERRPLLLIVEDLHWSDETSLEALLYIARRSRTHRILMVLTYRGDEAFSTLTHFLSELERRHATTELELPRLTPDQVDQMLRAIFNLNRSLRPDFLTAVYDLTDGNPFFVEEILKSLITSGDISYTDEGWDRQPISQLRIPRSVSDAVQHRAERLTRGARDLLALAAVVGQRFDFAVLQRITRRDEEELLQLIKELIAAQLVREVSADRFAFRHALSREVVYAQLLARERRSLHLTIAEALEALYASPSVREDHLADLAYHFYAANEWAKAWEYEQRAGQMALALYAPGAAIVHLTHALEAAQHLHAQPSSQVYHARGKAYETRGEFDQARDDYERALDVAQSASDSVMEWQSMMALGFLWAARDYAQAGAWFRRASEQAQHLSDPLLRARSLNRLGNWLLHTGHVEEGLQAHQEALGIFETERNLQGIAETHDLLAITYGMSGDRVKATKELGQAIALFRSLGDNPSLTSSLAMRAVQSMPGASETGYSPLRTRDECIQDAEEAVRLSRQIGSLVAQAFAENTLAHTLVSFGEFGPALLHAREAHRIATDIEHQQWIIATSQGLGRTYLLLLSPSAAMAHLEAGLSLARELGSMFWIASLSAHLGLAYLLNHDLAASQATLQAVMPREQPPRNSAERDVALAWGQLALAQGEPDVALQIAEQLRDSAPGKAGGQSAQPIPHLLKLKGDALMALCKLDQAVAALEDARRGAQERYARPVLWTIHRSLAQAHQLRHQTDQVRQERAAAHQLIEELAATIDDTALRFEFEQAALASLPQEKRLPLREAAKRAFGGLTGREREVAALIAQGKTSREIAATLVVSERTAEVHVSNILGKLGFTSRAQIAVWAVERGLVKS